MSSEEHCFYHPEREILLQCEQCGRSLCADCPRERAGKLLCRSCANEVVRAPALNVFGQAACVLGFLACQVWRQPLTRSIMIFENLALVMSFGATALAAFGAITDTGSRRTLNISIGLSAFTSGLVLITYWFHWTSFFRWLPGGSYEEQYLVCCYVCLGLMGGSLVFWLIALIGRTRPFWAMALALVCPLLTSWFIVVLPMRCLMIVLAGKP